LQESNFNKQKAQAVEKLREMSARSTNKKNENSNNATNNINKDKSNNNNIFSQFNLPFLDLLLKDQDSTLIIGLLLMLMGDNNDKLLLFALIYILF
jgi:hypothetical protein